MTSIAKFAVGTALAAAFCVTGLAAPAAVAADGYYEGKTVRIVVGFGAGGGYDTYARMLAPHYERFLGATVVVENHPGAGGMVALNKLNVAPPDGLSMAIVNGTGASLQQLLGLKGARFDLTGFKAIGTADYSVWQFLVSPGSPYKTLQDVMKSGKIVH